MPGQPSEVEALAADRYAEQVAIGLVASEVARAAWNDVDDDHVEASWLRLLLGRVLGPVRSAQVLAARGARPYVDRVVAAQARRRGRPVPTALARVVPERFAETAADGRPLETLLFQPAVTATRARREGRPRRESHILGYAQLDMIVRTEVADAGRVATGVQIAATPTLGYVRMLNPPSCSRCAILAGRIYRFNAGFARHPRCDCIHIPATEDQAGDLTTDPALYFASLSEAEQNRLFTRDGAQAIRDGANIGRVVNARRGMATAGGRLTTGRAFGRDVFLTSDRTRVRGSRRVRLMPEQIYIEAGGNRDEAIRLLNLHGYIT